MLKWLKNKLASPLPTGRKELETWLDDVIALAQLPNTPQNRLIAASMIFEVRPNITKVPKKLLADKLRKAASNQVALAAVKELRDAQEKPN